jgi:glycosyltransferase involved in cell wall biosynthesis
MKLSVIMPAYNEAATIKKVIDKVLNVDLMIDRELIVIDDGSKDGTRDILKQIQDSRVKVIFHEKNMGKGGALKTGFNNVTGDIVIIQDADLEYDPSDYIQLVRPIVDDMADVVYGSRFLSGPHRVLLFWHYVGNKMITLAANLLFNMNFTDIETGYKAFRSSILKAEKFSSNSFGFEAEFTAKVVKRKHRIYEVPIKYAGRTYDEGKKITWWDGVIALCILIKYRICG